MNKLKSILLILLGLGFMYGCAPSAPVTFNSEKEAKAASKRDNTCYTYKVYDKFCNGVQTANHHDLLINTKPSADGFGYDRAPDPEFDANRIPELNKYFTKIVKMQKKQKIDRNKFMFSKIAPQAIDRAIIRSRYRVRRGKTSMRFDIRGGDCNHGYNGQLDGCKTHRERSEVSVMWVAPMDVPVYYAYSMYMPKNYKEMDNPYQIIGQFHDIQANNFSNQYQDGQFYINIKYNHHDRAHVYIPNFTKGKWHDFLYKITWSLNDKKGKIEVWMDGKRVVDYRGRNLSDQATSGPYFKMGIYRSHLERYKHGTPPRQTLYFDEYRSVPTLESVSYKHNKPLD